MEIQLSKHALDQARERGISISEIKRTIQRGAKHLQDKNKIVSDFMHIKVVYKKMHDIYFIITVMIRK
ncbi:MAG TPA: DUF4258 domain-containing protein [Candidatus Woesearchaeota archaeon]|nr:DUF4258 domain-containing protein [Candidatus Woesearchaeota archaeon]